MSSDYTYDILTRKIIPNNPTYEKDGTTNGDDLYYSIHGFEYAVSSHNELFINDRYVTVKKITAD